MIYLSHFRKNQSLRPAGIEAADVGDDRGQVPNLKAPFLSVTGSQTGNS